MPDTALSAFPSATSMANADTLIVVQGGADKQVTKTLLLTGKAGEDIKVKSSSGQKVILESADGNTRVECSDAGVTVTTVGGAIEMKRSSGGCRIGLNSLGDVELRPDDGSAVCILGKASGAHINVDVTSNQMHLIASSGITVDNFDNGAGDWTTSPPVDWQTCLYRLSAAVRGLLGGTIP